MENRLAQDKIDRIAEKGRKSLFFLARGILGFDKMTETIHLPMCKELQEFKVNTRMEVIVPRSWYKSTLVSICYAIWRAINNPNIRILVVQNSHSNACKKLNEIKEIFENNALFRACYPELLPQGNRRWSGECLTVNRTLSAPEGTFEAAGIGTAVISRHYDVIIEDDTVAPKKDALTGLTAMPTPADIEKAIGWHRLAYPLLIDPSESQIIVVGTRWAERDLLSWVRDNSPEYLVMTRAAREKDGIPCTKDMGGVSIWPRFSETVLEQMERDLGPYMFSALYMNSPMSSANQLFKQEWMKFYNNLPENKGSLLYFTSVDPAASSLEETSDPDYSVVMTTCLNTKNGHVYVVHYNRERYNPGELINAIFDHQRVYKPVKVLIEGIAYQRTLGFWIKQKQKMMNMNFYVEVVKSLVGSKIDRVRGLQPYFANNQIFMRTDHKALMSELLAFPKGAHDDLPDCLSIQIPSWTEAVELMDSEINYKQSNNPHSFRSIVGELQERATNFGEGDQVMGINKYKRFTGTALQQRYA